MTMPQKKNAQTFESALERIEQIAAQMETGEMPLEQLVEAYEEGLKLVRFCAERLDEAEKRLEAITRDSAGRATGPAPVKDPEEIPVSTPTEDSGTEADSRGGGEGPARLF
jgi:exodeoxyribonuclease VII small subunit